jgi:hypothetical protein
MARIQTVVDSLEFNYLLAGFVQWRAVEASEV